MGNPFFGGGGGAGGGSRRQQGNPAFRRRRPVSDEETGGRADTGGLASRIAQLEGLVAAAEETGDEGLIDKARDLGSAVGGGALNIVGRALGVLDVPRAAVVSGINELIDAADQDDPASVKEFLDQAGLWPGGEGEHIGVGDIAEEYGEDWNPWVKRGLGFAGDVALDPLTYVTFGAGSVAKGALREGVEQGGRAITREGVEQAGRAVARGHVGRRAIQRRLLNAASEGHITREAAEEAVKRVEDVGVSALPEELAELVGVRTGVMFGVGRNRAVIPGTRRLAEAASELTGPARMAVKGRARRSPLLNSVADAFEVTPGLRKLRQTSPARALEVEDLFRASREAGFKITRDARASLATLVEEHGNVNMDALRRALEGDEIARDAVPEAYASMAKWLEDMRVAIEGATGRVVPKFEDYFPHEKTDALREFLAQEGKLRRSVKRRTGPELRRRFRKGEEFMGQTLEEGTVDEVNRIARDELGIDFFKADPFEVADAYIRHISFLAQRGSFERGLKERGLIKLFDVEHFKKAKKQYRRAEKRVEKALLQAEEAEMGAQEARRGAPEGGAVPEGTPPVPEPQAPNGDLLRAQAEADEAAIAVEQARMAAEATKRRGEPPVPEGHVRLYRGEGSRDDPPVPEGFDVDNTVGRWFTDNPDYARQFGKNTYYVDVPEGQVEAYRVDELGHALDDEEYLLPADLADRLRDIETNIPPPRSDQLLKQARGDVQAAKEHLDRLREFGADNERAIQAVKFEYQIAETRHSALMAHAEGLTRDIEFLKNYEVPPIEQQLPTRKGKGGEKVAALKSSQEAAEADVAALLDEIEQAKAAKASISEMADLREELKLAQKTKDDADKAYARATRPVGAKATKENPIEVGRNAVLAGKQQEFFDLRAAIKLQQANMTRYMQEARRLAGGRIDADPQSIAYAEKRLETATRMLDEEAARFDSARLTGKEVEEQLQALRMENESRLVELAAAEERLQAADEAVKSLRDQEVLLRRQAAEKMEMVESPPPEAAEVPDAGEVLRLEAASDVAAADAIQAGIDFAKLRSSSFFNETTKQEWFDITERGLREFSKGRWGDPDVADALVSIHELKRRGVGPLMRTYDKVMGLWKAYALLYPGFHFRNFMGGVFNNALAGVEDRSYTLWWKALHEYKRAGNSVDGIANPEVQDAVRHMFESGVFDETHARDIADIGELRNPKRGQAWNPLSQQNSALRLNRTYAVKVERHLRAPLFIDRYLKTGSLEEAAEAVRKYHFDYSDLSQAEFTFGKRLVPFYTWTRKNVPLQLEMMVRQPGKYTRYLHAKRNIELGTEDDPYVPQYYSNLLAIRVPGDPGSAFHRIMSALGMADLGQDGAPTYLTPDLPFINLSETLDPGALAGSMTPAITIPGQVGLSDKQWFSGIPFEGRMVEAPVTWRPLMPLLWAMRRVPGAPKVTYSEGKWLLNDSDAFKVESTLPVLARMRRLFPSEERYQSRAMTSYLSILMGIGARTLDTSQKYGEVRRRIDEIERLLNEHTASHPSFLSNRSMIADLVADPNITRSDIEAQLPEDPREANAFLREMTNG